METWMELERQNTALETENPTDDPAAEHMTIEFSDGRQIRACRTSEQGIWYYAVQDMIGLLARSRDPRQYIKKMRSRNPLVNENWEKWTTQHAIGLSRGTRYTVRTADWNGLLRLIEQIPGRKTRVIRDWLKHEGKEQLHKSEHPDLDFLYALCVLLEEDEDSRVPVFIRLERKLRAWNQSAPV